MTSPLRRLFKTGTVVATERALLAVDEPYLIELLARHCSGDWGNQCAEDRRVNENALVYGGRLMSSYPIDPTKPATDHGANVVWVITEADRSATTFLLPDEY